MISHLLGKNRWISKAHLFIDGYPDTVDGHIPLKGIPAGRDIGVAGDLHAGEHDAVGALVAVAEVNELGTVTSVVALEKPRLYRDEIA